MSNPTQELIKLSAQHGTSFLTDTILTNPKFAIWSGSSKPFQHHYGKGGLAQHTLEVTQLCLQSNITLGNPVPIQHILLAAIFHDCGKMWDYEPLDDSFEEWQGTIHKRRIHHISRSAIIWTETINNFKNAFAFQYKDEILHAILSHHGLREWGSPVSPNTKLAWLLHLCDGISARINDCDKQSDIT
jgi:3'-5' exoribonuclease